MRAVVQRVTQAETVVAGETVGEIGTGLLVFLGVGQDDSDEDLEYLVSKVANLRVFPDEKGRMNLSVKDVGGSVMVVSQFTLYGDCRRGRRPSFTQAALEDVGRDYYERFVAALQAEGLRVATGQFQAHMYVSLCNDGPVTLLLDSKKEF